MKNIKLFENFEEDFEEYEEFDLKKFDEEFYNFLDNFFNDSIIDKFLFNLKKFKKINSLDKKNRIDYITTFPWTLSKEGNSYWAHIHDTWAIINSEAFKIDNKFFSTLDEYEDNTYWDATLGEWSNKPLTENFEEDFEEEAPIDREVCRKCGNRSVHLFDMDGLYFPDKFEPDGMNFDDYVHAETICDKCGNREIIDGEIKWNR